MARRVGKEEPTGTFHLFCELPFDRREKPLAKSVAAYINPNAEQRTPLLVIELDNDRSPRPIEEYLWATYHEAREIIRSVDRKRAREREKGQDKQRGPTSTSTLTGRFTQGERELTLTYSPGRDLICFEKKDLRNILHWLSNTTSMPPFLDMRFINFALPYDKSWDGFFEDPFPMVPYYKRQTMDGIIFRACCKARAETFWVIDRVPRPKEGSNALAGAQYKYFGHGKRFVPVVNGNVWDLRNSKSHAFMYRLAKAVSTWQSVIIASQGLLDYPSPPKRFGVLGCVE